MQSRFRKNGARIGVLAAIAMGVLFAAAVSHSSAVAQWSPPTGSTLRVMTWNIQSYKSIPEFGRRPCQYAEEILRRNVDVVAMQEIQEPVAREKDPDPTDPETEANSIDGCLSDVDSRWEHRWIPVSNSKKIPRAGMAIFSRYPIVGSRCWSLPQIRNDKLPARDRDEFEDRCSRSPEIGDDEKYKRMLQRVTLAVGPRKVHVYNVHLGFGDHAAGPVVPLPGGGTHPPPCGQKDRQVQECQVEKILRIVEDRSDGDFTPVILGDFNVEPWKNNGEPGAVSLLTQAGFTDVWAAFHSVASSYLLCGLDPAAPDCGATIIARSPEGKLKVPDQRADFIFVRQTPKLGLVDVWTPMVDSLSIQHRFGRLSDHYPVTATFSFPDSTLR